MFAGMVGGGASSVECVAPRLWSIDGLETSVNSASLLFLHVYEVCVLAVEWRIFSALLS